MDFGRRGMACFLVACAWSPSFDAYSLPQFPLSYNELQRQRRATTRSKKKSSKANLTGMRNYLLMLCCWVEMQIYILLLRYWSTLNNEFPEYSQVSIDFALRCVNNLIVSLETIV
jgi:hypothetical protein